MTGETVQSVQFQLQTEMLLREQALEFRLPHVADGGHAHVISHGVGDRVPGGGGKVQSFGDGVHDLFPQFLVAEKADPPVGID